MLYYLVGIKGSGLCALAVALKEQGHIVCGVDVEKHFYTEEGLDGIRLESFNHMKLKSCYFYILGNAYVNHSVARYIMNMKYKYMTYPKFIAEYFKSYQFISVCGSHGKTTTTKMITALVPEASYIIGDGSGSGKGREIFVLESCEYRNTFLSYTPDIALILNIDYDHPDFFKTPEEYTTAFAEFSKKAKIVIANGDDTEVQKIKTERFITYGLSPDNEVIFTYEAGERGMTITILGSTFYLPFLGKHYAYDFVGAYLAAKLLGREDKEILERAEKMILPKRRLETVNFNHFVAVHDYAHHPTEIKSVLESMRLTYPRYRIVGIFQPHTISRSVSLKDSFKDALSGFDRMLVMRIFTSVREDINIAKEKDLFEEWGFPVLGREDIIHMKTEKNNVYVFMGAGDIDTVFHAFAEYQNISLNQ